MLPMEKNAEARMKHLEMIQAAIGRMSNHSNSAKNYCLTLVTALFGLAVASKHPTLILSGLLPIGMFLILDARYLAIERGFRELFDEVRMKNWTEATDFDLKPRTRNSWLLGQLGWSVSWFYAVILGVSLSAFAFSELLP